MGLLSRMSYRLDQRFGWDRLPRPFGVLTLIGIRQRLRERNLYDTGTGVPLAPVPAGDDSHLTARTLDGSYNDLSDPAMGAIGARFGRNVPIRRTWPEPEPAILTPNPRAVSRELLTRERFIPATTLNVLAGCLAPVRGARLVQPRQERGARPVAGRDRGRRPVVRAADAIPRTRRDPTQTGDGPPTFVTADSHWWDGSQIYGSESGFAAALRANEDGKLRVDSDGLLPRDLEQHVDLTGVAANFWLGLAVLHTLFTLEHNAICDRLRACASDLVG